ncbi:MAG: PP2C family protein-serine/threonine phosphatase [Vampirovibrionales bacterium]|nr:PP2C family protein-serine/threonine phosphatase [Vampirovibrionales bacterium]
MTFRSDIRAAAAKVGQKADHGYITLLMSDALAQKALPAFIAKFNNEVVLQDAQEWFNSAATPLTHQSAGPQQQPSEDAWVMLSALTLSAWLQELKKAQTYNEQIGQLNEELYERNMQVEKELYTARQLQQSLLPPFLEDDPHRKACEQNASSLASCEQTCESPHEALIDGFELFEPERPKFSKCHIDDKRLRITGVYLPCDSLGGDIYDVISFPDGSIDVSVADVSGHGVPAGFITAIYKSTCYRATHTYHQPGDILYHVNQELCQLVKTGHYVTSVYCKLKQNIQQGGLWMAYAGAGHPYPMRYKAETGTIERLQENGLPLAWMSGMAYETRSIMLNAGDKVLLFTDGVSELKNFAEELYGEERLEALFLQLAEQVSPQEPLLDGLINALSEFADGAPLPDDISVLLVEVK